MVDLTGTHLKGGPPGPVNRKKWLRFDIFYFPSIRNCSHFASLGCLLRIAVRQNVLQAIGGKFDFANYGIFLAI